MTQESSSRTQKSLQSHFRDWRLFCVLNSEDAESTHRSKNNRRRSVASQRVDAVMDGKWQYICDYWRTLWDSPESGFWHSRRSEKSNNSVFASGLRNAVNETCATTSVDYLAKTKAVHQTYEMAYKTRSDRNTLNYRELLYTLLITSVSLVRIYMYAPICDVYNS